MSGLATFLFLGVSCFFASASARADDLVYHTQIRGTINPATADYLESAIGHAERAGATAVVVSLDTPGGLVSSVKSMAQAIDRSPIPVVVYVEPAGASATSAGALLMLAAHVSAMTPGSHMGAAHPVDSSGKGIEGPMGEKVLSDTAAFAEGLAEVRGRNRNLAADIVRKSRSFTAAEASSVGLVDVLADSFPALLRGLDGRVVKLPSGKQVKLTTANAKVHVFEMNWGQQLLHIVSNPNIAAILMTLGMLLIYVELNNPGVQIAGILGAVFLVVAFISFQTLPIRTGGIVLIALGAIALVAEIFTATHGALSAGGVLSFVLGLIWIIDPAQTRYGVSPAVWIPAGLFFGGVVLLVGWFAARIKKSSEEALQAMKGGALGGLAGYRGTIVESDHPGGTLLIRGERWDYALEGDRQVGEEVRPGDAVEVVRVEGLKAYVKKWKGNSND